VFDFKTLGMHVPISYVFISCIIIYWYYSNTSQVEGTYKKKTTNLVPSIPEDDVLQHKGKVKKTGAGKR